MRTWRLMLWCEVFNIWTICQLSNRYLGGIGVVGVERMVARRASSWGAPSVWRSWRARRRSMMNAGFPVITTLWREGV